MRDESRRGLPFAGRFRAPDSGVAELRCPALRSPVVIGPDDVVFIWLGLGLFAAIGFGLLAIAALVVLLVIRSRRRAAPSL